MKLNYKPKHLLITITGVTYEIIRELGASYRAICTTPLYSGNSKLVDKQDVAATFTVKYK